MLQKESAALGGYSYDGTRARSVALKILLVGHLAPPVGGTTVLFGSLVRALAEREDVSARVLEPRGIRGGGVRSPFRYLRLLCRVLSQSRSSDVIALHIGTRALPLLAPAMVVIAKATGKPLVVRKFGGTSLSELRGAARGLAAWSARHADLYLVETKQQVESARRMGVKNVRWFSNSRPLPPLEASAAADARRCSRFAYVGQLWKGKGLAELTEAGERLGGGAAVDVYGQLGFDVPAEWFDGLRRVRYVGEIRPEDVHAVLSEHDALLVPTYMETEGYPGVVLEAYAAGIPVVATRWRALPEIVDERTGVLVEPRDAEALRAAMQKLVDEPELYRKLLHGVRERRSEFSEELWNERFVEMCRDLARGEADLR